MPDEASAPPGQGGLGAPHDTSLASALPDPAHGPGQRPCSFLAFDYGTRRVGVAAGNSLLAQALPLTTISAQGDARFAAIAALLDEWQPDALVVGVPTHPDGQPHENTLMARRFARQLHGRFGLQVHEVDERFSTTEALAMGATDADAAAAAIILNQFLNPIVQALDAAS